MGERIAFVFFVLLANLGISQEVHVAGGGELFISSKDALYINNNLTVNASGSVTVSSDLTSSGSILVSGTTTGSIIYQRYVNQNVQNGNGWHLITSPVTTQGINDFATNVNGANSIATNGNRYAIAAYNNAMSSGNRWEYYDTTTAPVAGNFVSGEGYSMKRTVGGLLTFEGAMASSDVLSSLSTASGTHYWSCIGNPFPSYLPVNNNANGTNVLGQNLGALDPSFAALYFWDGAQYVAVNQITSATYLSPGQAFFVRAKSNNESFTFSESLTSHQAIADNFNRSTNTISSVVIHLSNGNQQKSTELKYLPNADVGLDVGYDAGAYQDGQPDFSLDTHLVSDSQGVNFTLQCLPDNAYDIMVVPLSVNAAANQHLIFSAIATNLPEGIDIYLEDKIANTFTKINETPYEVTTDDPISDIGRFYIHTSPHTLSTEEVSDFQPINIYKTNASNIRITGLQDDGNIAMRMYSIGGKEVLRHSFVGQHLQDIAVPKSLKAGLYIVQIISEKRIRTKKLIIE
ncbi:T9SS type A sorting domain-containing protein [Flavobacteriaceae bacterium S356]|uniref:T9SS type A sorting domain-containing protein n=1 Tax=Asprobacillus argus TaxID=3076534 RepID=A0ABU3LBL5_9FLAO|nr:T9SS type A sorting domain-containing protein [Flavobacteriaceae bacterium S356]